MAGERSVFTPALPRVILVPPIYASSRSGYRCVTGTWGTSLWRSFKERYEKLLKEEISGSRVSQCETEGIETVYFDIPGDLTQ
jgi:hypothetical protein